jgi:hypothetical protein
MTRRAPVRATIERITYGAAMAGLVTLPPLDDAGIHLAVAALGGGCACWLYRKVRRGDMLKALRTGQRVLPAVTGTGLYAAEVLVPGSGIGELAWEYGAPAAWGGLMSWWLPISRSIPRRPAPPARPSDADLVAAQWANSEAAQGTRLEEIQLLPGQGLTAIVVAPKGKAVPQLVLRDVAALFAVAEPRVSVREVPGSGPGRMRLNIAPASRPLTVEALWAERVAAADGAIPGSRVTRIEYGADRTAILAAVPAGKVARVNHGQLCSAFDVKAEELRLVAETDGGPEVLVTVYDKAPLLNTRQATRELVTPDADGYWVVGTAHDGSDAMARLWDPKLGALHGFVVGITGSGKTVILVLRLAAEANAGAVSWLASLDPDAQLAAAGAYIDRQGSGRLYAARMTRAAVALMRIRGEINAEVGHDFSPASPYPLLVLSLDEFNGLCDDSDLGQEIAKNVLHIAERGRKYGIAVEFAGQILDLERIGGQRSLREQTRGGTGIALRTVSSISDRQAVEGMLPEGVELAPIPQTIGGGASMADRLKGVKVAPGEPTAGMGHVLLNGQATLMRALYVDLPKDGTGHRLDDIFPEGGMVNTLTRREINALGKLYGDWNAGPGTPPPPPSGSAPTEQEAAPPAAKEFTVKERILAVLRREMTSEEIRGAVSAAAGTVRNALYELVKEGRIQRTSHGAYAPIK